MPGEAVTLRPMTAEQYDAFMDSLLPRYAEERIAAGADPETARQQATDGTARLLPQRHETPGHGFYLGYADDTAVGSLCLAFESPNEGGGAWIYYVLVDQERRGKGYGRALMRAAEAECRRRGIAALGLNVFGGNVARGLYESLGYAVTAQQMRKDLTAD